MQGELKNFTSETGQLKTSISQRETDLSDARNLLQLARTEINQNEKTNAELRLALHSAETVRKTNSSIDRNHHNEISHLRKIIRKHEKETIMYKELLTTTSS